MLKLHIKNAHKRTMTASEKRLMTIEGFYLGRGDQDLTMDYEQDIYSNIDTILS